MFRSVTFRRLFLTSLVLICATTIAVAGIGAYRLHSVYMQGKYDLLQRSLLLSADRMQDVLQPQASPAMLARVKFLGDSLGCRITIIRRDGVVVADSLADVSKLDNHAGRPEIVSAFAHNDRSVIRASSTFEEPMLYRAHAVTGLDGQEYAIRLSVFLRDLNDDLTQLYWGTALIGAGAMAIATVACFYIARRYTRPIVDLTGFADTLARGELERRTPRSETGEFGKLAGSLNSMADSFGRLIAQTRKDKNELLTILTSMAEGVIAMDTRQCMQVVNQAAGELLGFSAPEARGKLLWQVIRNDQILTGAMQVLSTGERKTFQIGPLAGKFLEITMAPLPARGPREGLVIVTHDTTQSVRYQELRKEFVANVSHELRTPLSVIKGYVETLRDGAAADPLKGPQYLATIERHANQLTNLVNDLLELSKLESHALLPNCTSVDLSNTIRKAVELLQPALQKKGHTLTVDVPNHLPPVFGNPDYLERAVVNLLDNAAKYTPEHGRISVVGKLDTTYVIIEVTDNGLGIPSDDIPRIFERFYRVDRSRSREMGGTGLGLSIVKHILQSHAGTIEVVSEPGTGSTFRIKLPVQIR